VVVQDGHCRKNKNGINLKRHLQHWIKKAAFMPILRSREKLIYFSHIPKCGGASIEAYLAKIGKGNLAFVDNRYNSIPIKSKWTNSSPQHIDGRSLARLFPVTFFDTYFAIVRDPIKRFESAFNFQKNVEKKINSDIKINDFVAALDEKSILRIGHFDGHFMPQFLFLHPRASYRFFKLENGMEPVKKYLDHLLFENELSVTIPHLNAKRPGTAKLQEALTKANKTKLTAIYKQDYLLFGY
jgi:hypothetical protein